jgi:hypothetical protein
MNYTNTNFLPENIKVTKVMALEMYVMAWDRHDNTMAKRKTPKTQTTIYKPCI